MKAILKVTKYSFTLLCFVIGLGFAGVWAYDIFNRPNLVAGILKIEALPQSVRVTDCKSPFTTDVLTTCAIEVSPEEFEDLLVGYEFNHSSIKRSSHSVGSTSVGTEFEVTNQYEVWPEEFTNGGAVHVFANKNKDRAIVNLYIE